MCEERVCCDRSHGGSRVRGRGRAVVAVRGGSMHEQGLNWQTSLPFSLRRSQTFPFEKPRDRADGGSHRCVAGSRRRACAVGTLDRTALGRWPAVEHGHHQSRAAKIHAVVDDCMVQVNVANASSSSAFSGGSWPMSSRCPCEYGSSWRRAVVHTCWSDCSSA